MTVRNIKTREGYEHWDKLCAIPRYGFIHSQDNSRILKAEGIGNWIDMHAAQEVVDAAQDEINELRAEIEALRKAPSQAAADVLSERRRQIEAEGWTPERDDSHGGCGLSAAAGCYAMYTLAYPAGDPPPGWPWDKSWWKPGDERRNRVKAAALLLAEIERLDRAAMAAKEGV